MTIKELINNLQKIEDQNIEVHLLNDDTFLSLTDENLTILEIGDPCDENGNIIIDEYPEIKGTSILCINWNNN